MRDLEARLSALLHEAVPDDFDTWGLAEGAKRRALRARRVRIAAVSAGVALAVVATGVVATGGFREQAVVTPADLPSLTRVNAFVGIPPLGARPSAPQRGDLVLEVPVHATGCGLNASDRSGSPVAAEDLVGSVHVYADGRVVRAQQAARPEGANPAFTGYLERRLTPAGVERLLAEALTAGRHHSPRADSAFSGWGCTSFAKALEGTTWVPLYRRYGADPFGYPQLFDLSWLPTDLWAEPSWHGYVPSELAVCYDDPRRLGKEALLERLPDGAARLLRARSESMSGVVGWDDDAYCAVLRTEDARSLAVSLDHADIPRDARDSFGLAYRLGSSSADAARVTSIVVEPVLPHGAWVCSGCG